jgi:hypothetical protein
MLLLRSVTVAKDRNPTIENTLDKSTIEEPKLRTFRGWKRNTEHLDKSRLSKSVWLTHVSEYEFMYHSISLLKISSEPTTPYDATKEMNTIFRPVRYEIFLEYNKNCLIFFTFPVKFKINARERKESI